MKSHKISISLNNFHYWFTDPSLCQILSWLLPLFAKKTGGFEISLPFNCLENLANDLEKGKKILPLIYQGLSGFAQETIFNCENNSFHLEDLKNLTRGNEKWLAKNLNRISRLTGVKVFTTHPDDVRRICFGTITDFLENDVSISVENMCHRKSNMTSLGELDFLLRRFPRLGMTLDINHWIELGHSLQEKEFCDFIWNHKNRINKIHFSAPATNAIEYESCPVTSHYTFVNSNYEDLASDLKNLFFTLDTNIVLEGLVPIHGVEILEQEIEFINNLLDVEQAGLARLNFK